MPCVSGTYYTYSSIETCVVNIPFIEADTDAERLHNLSKVTQLIGVGQAEMRTQAPVWP